MDTITSKNKINQACDIVTIWSPWWAPYLARVNFSYEGQPGTRLTGFSTMIITVDREFLETSTIMDTALALEYALQQSVRNMDERMVEMENRHDGCPPSFIGLAAALEINTDINEKFQYLNQTVWNSLVAKYVDKDYVYAMGVSKAPELPEGSWLPEMLGLESGRRAEFYLEELIKMDEDNKDSEQEESETENPNEADEERNPEDNTEGEQLEDETGESSEDGQEAESSDSSDNNQGSHNDSSDSPQGDAQQGQKDGDLDNSRNEGSDKDDSSLSSQENGDEEKSGDGEGADGGEGESGESSPGNQSVGDKSSAQQSRNEGQNGQPSSDANNRGESSSSEGQGESFDTSGESLHSPQPGEDSGQGQQSSGSQDASGSPQSSSGSSDGVGGAPSSGEMSQSAQDGENIQQGGQQNSSRQESTSSSSSESISDQGGKSVQGEQDNRSQGNIEGDSSGEQKEHKKSLEDIIKENSNDVSVQQMTKPQMSRRDQTEEVLRTEREAAEKEMGEAIEEMVQQNHIPGIPGPGVTTGFSEWAKTKIKKSKKKWLKKLRSITAPALSKQQLSGMSDMTYEERNPEQQEGQPIMMGFTTYAPNATLLVDASPSVMARKDTVVSEAFNVIKSLFMAYSQEVTVAIADGEIQYAFKSLAPYGKGLKALGRTYNGTSYNFGETIEKIIKKGVKYKGMSSPAPDILVIITDCEFTWPFPERTNIENQYGSVLIVSTSPWEDIERYLPLWVKNGKNFVYAE